MISPKYLFIGPIVQTIKSGDCIELQIIEEAGIVVQDGQVKK